MDARRIEIKFSAASHHGSGYGLSGVVDRAIARDSTGLPYLAASAIKGKLRHAAVRWLLAQGKRACQYGDDPGICKTTPYCDVCVLFGSPVKQGKLLFTDAYPTGNDGAVIRLIDEVKPRGVYHRDSSIRFGNGVSRKSGRVRSQLLFSSETLPQELVFEAIVRGSMTEAEEDFLQQVCRVLTHFGAGGARGLGGCRFRLVVE